MTEYEYITEKLLLQSNEKFENNSTRCKSLEFDLVESFTIDVAHVVVYHEIFSFFLV